MVACRVEILAADAMTPHVAAWADLVTRCLEPSVYNEPAFALTAARLLPARREPRFLLVWDGGSRLIGLCCVVEGLPGFPLAAWMHAQATAAFPLLDRHDAPRALTALAARLADRAPGLLLQGLPADGETAGLLARDPCGRRAVIERRARAVLRHATPLPPLGMRGDKELRRQARRLADRGAVTTASARAPHEVATAIDQFLALEAQGWKGRQGTALSQSRALSEFTRSMTLGLARTGQCRVDSLTVAGMPVAVSIVLRSGRRAFYWKTAYDEALRRLSPGVQLAQYVTAAQHGESDVDLTDSCAVPGHAMIDRLWPERMEVVDILWAPVETGAWRFTMAVRLELARRAAWRALKRIRRKAQAVGKRPTR